MHDHYRLIHTQQRPNAPLSRVNQGFGDNMSVKPMWGVTRGKQPGIDGHDGQRGGGYDVGRDAMLISRRWLCISQAATRYVLRNRKIRAFPASGPALLVLNGPECTSLMKSDWAVLGKENMDRMV